MILNLPIKIKSVCFSQIDDSDNSRFNISEYIYKIAERDFIITVDKIAKYRIYDGDFIEIDLCEDADEKSVNLILNTYVLGALLHQRAQISFHGSSFILNGKGIVICGNSGAGKSSISYALCRSEGVFQNDDITPVKITPTEVIMLPLNDKIKLWEETLKKLNIDFSSMESIRPELNKFFIPVGDTLNEESKLHHIIVLSVRSEGGFSSRELSGIDKYNALRKSIYRKSYLRGMPEIGKRYFSQLLDIARFVRVTEVVRPDDCDIVECAGYIHQLIFNK